MVCSWVTYRFATLWRASVRWRALRCRKCTGGHIMGSSISTSLIKVTRAPSLLSIISVLVWVVISRKFGSVFVDPLEPFGEDRFAYGAQLRVEALLRTLIGIHSSISHRRNWIYTCCSRLASLQWFRFNFHLRLACFPKTLLSANHRLRYVTYHQQTRQRNIQSWIKTAAAV